MPIAQLGAVAEQAIVADQRPSRDAAAGRQVAMLDAVTDVAVVAILVGRMRAAAAAARPVGGRGVERIATAPVVVAEGGEQEVSQLI